MTLFNDVQHYAQQYDDLIECEYVKDCSRLMYSDNIKAWFIKKIKKIRKKYMAEFILMYSTNNNIHLNPNSSIDCAELTKLYKKPYSLLLKRVNKIESVLNNDLINIKCFNRTDEVVNFLMNEIPITEEDLK